MAVSDDRWWLLAGAVVASWVAGLVGGIFAARILGLAMLLNVVYLVGDIALGISAFKDDNNGLLIGTVVALVVILVAGGLMSSFATALRKALIEQSLSNHLYR